MKDSNLVAYVVFCPNLVSIDSFFNLETASKIITRDFWHVKFCFKFNLADQSLDLEFHISTSFIELSTPQKKLVLLDNRISIQFLIHYNLNNLNSMQQMIKSNNLYKYLKILIDN